MSDIVRFDQVSKRYRLGASTRSLRDTLQSLVLRQKTEGDLLDGELAGS